MNCREARSQIFAERDGVLDEVQRAALASHVAGCAECRRIQFDITVGLDTARTEQVAMRVPDADLEWQKLRRQMRPPASSRRSMIGWMAIPATLAAAAVVGLYVASNKTAPTTATPSPTIVASTTKAEPAAPSGQNEPSTLVYVDDKSGWTFVWSSDNSSDGQHI